MNYKYLTYDKIDDNKFASKLAINSKEGASLLFFGTIRDNSMGKKVLYLEYEAYEELAEKTIDEIINLSRKNWKLQSVKALHRLGKLEVGDIAVAIDIRSEHRDEAYKASRFIIDSIKHKAPIWKKEYFDDGTSQWAKCAYHSKESLVP